MRPKRSIVCGDRGLDRRVVADVGDERAGSARISLAASDSSSAGVPIP